MGMKEVGACGALVVGGAFYGISQYGLNDAMSEDMRHISEVSPQERSAYMKEVVADFREAFETYEVQSETYAYVGLSKFATAPADGRFIEVVTQRSPVPQKEISGLRAIMEATDFCNQDEMTMFTENGWIYNFSMQDSGKQNIFTIACNPVSAGKA